MTNPNNHLQAEFADALRDAEEAQAAAAQALDRLHKLAHRIQCRAKKAGLLEATVSTRSGGTGEDKPDEP
jgi:hypothetical protein